MNIKKTTLVLSAVWLIGASLEAQTKDITVIVAPSAGYTFWNKNLNLGQSPFWGVRAGFAVGPLVEIRGLYEKSFDLKGKLQGSGWSVLNNIGNDLTGSSVNVTRFGGELKLNVWSNAILTPYVTAGAGVMTFRYNDTASSSNYKEEQLYTALGAGLKINLAKRIALALEAKNHIFNVNEQNRFLSANVSGDKALQNWTAQASLDFYLGGRKYTSDAVARAFRSYYGNGFKGLKFVFEPGMTYLDFHSESYLRDTYMLGGNLGLDFGQYLGVRGFYYQSTQTANTLNLKLSNDLKMYGGNLLARLNVSRGVTPYINLGAGYLNVANNYIDSQGTSLAKSGWFALGGAGLEVPLHRTLVLYGQANAMLNEQDNTTLSKTNPAEVKVNWALQTGLRFNFGKKSESGESLYRAYAEHEVNAERETNNNKINELRSAYDARIDSLNNELTLAIQKRADVEALDSLALVDSPAIAAPILTVDSIAKPLAPSTPTHRDEISLTDEQLDRLAGFIAKRQVTTTPAQTVQGLSDFDRLLLFMAAQNKAVVEGHRIDTVYLNQTAPTTNQTPKANKTQDDTTERRITVLEERMERRLDRLEQLLNNSIRAKQQPVVVTIENDKTKTSSTTTLNQKHLVPEVMPTVQQNLQPASSKPAYETVVRDTIYQTITDTLTIKEEIKSNKQIVYFAIGSSRVDTAATSALYQLADDIKAKPSSKIILRGYASPEGNERNNYALATARCKAVARTLIERGVTPSSVEIDKESYILRNVSDPRFARCVVVELQ